MSIVPVHLSSRDKVNLIEEELRKFPQIEVPVTHFYCGGVYLRCAHIPRGALVTGHIHKCENRNFLIKGEISVLLGDHVERLKAPHAVFSPPGTKRIAFAHDDTIWATMLITSETDHKMIEKIFIAKSEEDYQEFLRLALTEIPNCLS